VPVIVALFFAPAGSEQKHSENDVGLPEIHGHLN